MIMLVQDLDAKLEEARLVKEILVAAGFHVGKTSVASQETRCLCVYLERGAPDPLAEVIKLIVEESIDVAEKGDVIDSLYHVSNLLSHPEYTAKTNASAMVVFWRNIPWTE